MLDWFMKRTTLDQSYLCPREHVANGNRFTQDSLAMLIQVFQGKLFNVYECRPDWLTIVKMCVCAG